MNRDDKIKHWIEISNHDYQTMNNLFNSKDFTWSLFIGHLVIEKLLKALYLVNTEENNPPKTHNLLQLANHSELTMSEEQADLFDLVTTFNISSRYPDYKYSFYNKCTLEYTRARIDEIKELREWLLAQIQNK